MNIAHVRACMRACVECAGIYRFYCGVYEKRPFVCNGKPVYQKGKDGQPGPVLLLVEKAPDWGGYAPGLHWTLRLQVVSGGLGEPLMHPDDNSTCLGPHLVSSYCYRFWILTGRVICQMGRNQL